MTHSCARTHVRRARHDSGPEPAPAIPVPASPAPSHEEIARLAYACWEERGRQSGSPQEDWYRAERELLRRRASAELSLVL